MFQSNLYFSEHKNVYGVYTRNLGAKSKATFGCKVYGFCVRAYTIGNKISNSIGNSIGNSIVNSIGNSIGNITKKHIYQQMNKIDI